MSLRPLAAALLLLAPLACALRPYDPQSSATGTTDATSSTTADPTTSTSAPTSTSTNSTTFTASTGAPASTGTSCAFLDCGPSPDLPEGNCDIWTDDCPEGQKCMPVSLDGDSSWESARCVPLVPDPDHADEACTLLGTGLDGLDTCGRRELCWFVDWDTKMGTCIAMCTGPQEMPSCDDPKAHCVVAADAVLLLCLPDCDPLQQNCPELCIPMPSDPDHFMCTRDESGLEGQALDPCEFVDACDPGLLCLDPALAVECDPMAAGCCLPFCDLTQPNTCPGKAQQCLPYHDPPLPGYENLGLCGLPPP